MKLGVKIKEKIARVIAEHFTTNEIVNVFTDANIKTDKSLYAKWRITLDAFSKVSTEEGFFHILGEFCHPLNFQEKQIRLTFIQTLKTILSYEDIDVFSDDRRVQFVPNQNRRESEIMTPTEIKTSTDYIVEAINFFKDEYNKVKIDGISYEYSLGENINSDQVEGGRDDYSEKLQAIEQLQQAGLIKEYKIIDKVEGCIVWDYAVCKIDEKKLTQKEAPSATEAGVKELTKKIIHEHIHHFDNSIQEKEIGLNIKNVEDNTIVKNNKKRITLPKFPRTEWSKVSITFLEERNILLSDGKNTKPSSFEGLGCNDGRTGKPDDNWDFFLKLSKGNGQTLPISKKEREKQKKQKQKITDILRKIFQNDTDPFETEVGGVYKAKFSIKYTADDTKKRTTKSKYSDLEEVFSEMTEPSQEDIESEFSQ